MAFFIKSPARFDTLNMLVLTSVYENIGDGNDTLLRKPLATNDYPIKSILTKGSCLMEFPDTDTPGILTTAPGPIFPTNPVLLGKKRFKMTTLTDGVESQCVQPYPGYRIIVQSDNDNVAGEQLEIEKGVLVFVFGDNYTVNNDTYSDFQIFAIQNNNIIVNLINDARIVIFKSIKV